MKILVLTNKMPFPARDGGSIATLTLAEALFAEGNEMHILAMNTSKHFVNSDIIPQDLQNKLGLNWVDVDTSLSSSALISNYLFKKTPYNAERFINNDFKQALITLLHSNSFDIVQLEGLYLCPYIQDIRQHSKALIALRAHNIEHEIWERTVSNETLYVKRSYLRNLSQRIRKFEIGFLNNYDLLIPITERDARKYQKLGNKVPVQVIPTGIDASSYIPIENGKWPGLFHIGALDWLPNQEGLIWFIEKCWPILRKKHPTLEFTIAGRNAPVSFVEKLKVDGIRYVGEVENAIHFINQYSIMIVPLLSGSGMRIKIVEGMALGKVIVTTSIGTEGINSSHNDNILIGDTAQVFAHEVDKVITNRNLFVQISKNAVKFVSEHFNHRAIAEKLSSFYEANLK